jgi:hypothetical protein
LKPCRIIGKESRDAVVRPYNFEARQLGLDKVFSAACEFDDEKLED